MRVVLRLDIVSVTFEKGVMVLGLIVMCTPVVGVT